MGGGPAEAQDAGHAGFTIPTTSAADERAHLSSLRLDRAIALAMGDDELADDLDIDIAASADASWALRSPRSPPCAARSAAATRADSPIPDVAFATSRWKQS